MTEMTISRIYTNSNPKALVDVIRESFQTIAHDFHLTPSNAPKNPAFITLDLLAESLKRGLEFYGAFIGDKLIGCIAIEASKKHDEFLIERLAVLPEYRHKGCGKRLFDFACGEIIKKGGKTALIEIIDENTILKKWYIKNGFHEFTKKKYDQLPFTVCFMRKDLLNR